MLEQVNLADFPAKRKRGWTHPLAEKEGNLSGGQCQRLALARALLHDSPVYIFDEATSNIDVESENDIMAQIHALAGRKTVILISHRLANVTASDRHLCAGPRQRRRTAARHRRTACASTGCTLCALGRAAGAGKLRKGRCKGMNTQKKRSGFTVMAAADRTWSSRWPAIWLLAIFMGLVGHLCASVHHHLRRLRCARPAGLPRLPLRSRRSLSACWCLRWCAAAVRYAEQACNHFIAFKLLALIRDHGLPRAAPPLPRQARRAGTRAT